HQQIPPNGPPPSGLNIPPPPIPGLGVPLLPHVSQYQNIPHQNQYSSDDGSGSVDNSAYDFENSPLRNRNFQPSFFGDPGLNQESLINAMGNMSLENEGYGYMIPSGYGGYGVTDIPHYNQLLPEGEPQEEEEEDQEEEEEGGEGEGDDGHEDDKEEQTEEISAKEEVDEKETT
ncbi:RNA-binding protein, putative (U1 snrnp protein, putative), partial [Candida maltosa Xu316]